MTKIYIYAVLALMHLTETDEDEVVDVETGKQPDHFFNTGIYNQRNNKGKQEKSNEEVSINIYYKTTFQIII